MAGIRVKFVREAVLFAVLNTNTFDVSELIDGSIRMLGSIADSGSSIPPPGLTYASNADISLAVEFLSKVKPPANSRGDAGCAITSNRVTIPKLLEPPFNAQKRSEFEVALALMISD